MSEVDKKLDIMEGEIQQQQNNKKSKKDDLDVSLKIQKKNIEIH